MEHETIRKLTDKEYRLVIQLFIGKVTDEIGIDKTLELIREAKEAILNLKLK